MQNLPASATPRSAGSGRLVALTQFFSLFSEWRAYLELCKPRVVALMILTAVVGMQLATPGLIPWRILIIANLGIALTAGGAAAINHLVDQRFDALMRRTQKRPLPMQRLSSMQVIIFAFILACSGMIILVTQINLLTAGLTLLTFIGYALIYSIYLKHATPQNIVIGGLSGALPPLLGWTAVTGHIDPQALLLVLIIFLWTPPHFWALAIHRREEYAHADIPMLPNTHGIAYTKLQVVLYTVLLFASSLLPFVLNMSGWCYFIAAIILGSRFMYWAWRLYNSDYPPLAIKTFRFSIIYLMGIFMALLIDHCLINLG